jgi:hypothetical protein
MQLDSKDFEFADVVNQIAAHLAPRTDRPDILGYFQDDYRSELCLKAILASRRFQGDRCAERVKYVLKALWNHARTCQRARYRRKRFRPEPFVRQLDPIDLEERITAKRSLEALQKNLDKTSLKVLIALAGNDGDVSATWREDPQYNRKYYSLKVRQARDAGRKVLQD